MNLSIENARLAFRNFSGEEKKYNREGDRNFCIMLDEESARKLDADGWNIKYLNPREEDDLPQPYIKVVVSYKNVPPNIWLITSKKKTLMTEETISILDWAEIANADVIINPYKWEIGSGSDMKSGIKAYLKTLYVTIVEDEFSYKYEDLHTDDF